MEINILIPARAGSKRIKNKNLINIKGQPLISYSILESLKITRNVYVSTDSDEIAEVSKRFGAKIVYRPKEISDDFSKSEETAFHFINNVGLWKDDFFILVQPTSPMIKERYIEEGVGKMVSCGYDSVISVCEDKSFFWNHKGESINFEQNSRQRTQDMLSLYRENGCFYIAKVKNILNGSNFSYGKVGFVLMPKYLSFEIDEYEDLEIITKLI